MTAIPKLTKCPNCGHQYMILLGGFINKSTPSHCPRCGASASRT